MAVPATDESPPTSGAGVDPPQALRFRKTGRPATIAEENGAQRRPSLPFPRRASSIMSDSSFDRVSFRSSTEDFLRPRPNNADELHEEPSLWYSLPLFFALIPAVGGIFFKRGSVVLTDFILLAFAAIYLNWCLVTPWYWYHSAQTVRIAKPLITEAVVDTDPDEDPQDTEENTDVPENGAKQDEDNTHMEAALRELQIHELFALSLCFLGPLLGAYVLHVIRHNLSSFTDDMISSLHLTLFVLAAELRPLRYCLKMVQARSIHLQRVVREDPHAVPLRLSEPGVQDLGKRLSEMESAVSLMKSDTSTAANDAVAASAAEAVVKKSQTTMQSQIDALNRAVRRYEKRATAQTIQNEARLQDLENRLRDALSLAAAAANYGQEPGVLQRSLMKITTLFFVPLKALWVSVTFPFTLAAKALVRVLLRLGLVQDVKPRRSAQRTKPKAGQSAPSKGTIKR